MTLETCYKRLEIAKARGDSKEIKMYEAKIAHRLGHEFPQEPKEEVKKNARKKSKRSSSN